MLRIGWQRETRAMREEAEASRLTAWFDYMCSVSWLCCFLLVWQLRNRLCRSPSLPPWLSKQAAKVLCCVRTDRGSRGEAWTCLKLAPEPLVPGLKKFAPQFKYCILDSSSYPFFNEIWQPDDVLLVITELQISYHSNLVEPQMSARGSENILQYSSLRFYSVS